MKIHKIPILIILVFASCKPKITVQDDNGNSIELNVTEIEFTSSELEAKKDEKIYESINSVLKNSSESIFKNYLFLCDTSNINSLRDYDVNHKIENIKISIGKKKAIITPIPGVYKIVEGPFAEYKIRDDSLGNFHSYIVEVNLDENYQVKDFKGILRFAKKQENGMNKVSFKKRNTERRKLSNRRKNKKRKLAVTKCMCSCRAKARHATYTNR